MAGLKIKDKEIKTVRREAAVAVRDLLELAKRTREIPRWALDRFQVLDVDGRPLALDHELVAITWTETSQETLQLDQPDEDEDGGAPPSGDAS